MIIRVVVWIAIGLAAIVTIIALVGWSLPVKHRASRATTLRASREAVHALISDVEHVPRWSSRVSKVEILPPVDGRPSFRETGNDGTITYVVDESVPGERYVTRIADRSLPFGGRWIFETTSVPDGTELRITEEGEVYNPIFRFLSRFVFGHDSTIKSYLRDVERHFGS